MLRSLVAPNWFNNGRSIVWQIVKNDLNDMMEALVDTFGQNGLDLNITDKQGFTPLHFAVRKRNFRLIQLILDNPSFNPNQKDNLLDRTPLHEFVSGMKQTQEDFQILSLLTTHCNPNILCRVSQVFSP